MNDEMGTTTQRSAVAPVCATPVGAAEPASLRIRSMLMARLRDMIAARHLTQAEAARWLNVSQPRVSHLVHDRTNRFTTDSLVNMLAHAGVRVSIEFDEAGTGRAPRRDIFTFRAPPR